MLVQLQSTEICIFDMNVIFKLLVVCRKVLIVDELPSMCNYNTLTPRFELYHGTIDVPCYAYIP